MRDIRIEDAAGLFALDSDPEVLRFLPMVPVTQIDQSVKAVESIRKRYTEQGIGRWAVVEKSTMEFVGWSGLTMIARETNGHANFGDLGYRFLRKHWGKGFATETSVASLKYAFETLKLDEVCGHAYVEHAASRRVLEKVGLRFTNEFADFGHQLAWYKITKEEYCTK